MIAERLAAAAREGIAENFGRWLDFIGWRAGQVIELQALKVPSGRFEATRFAHADTHDALVRLLNEGERFGAQGVFSIANWLDPAVSARKGVGRWHDAMKGESTSDRDVRSRSVLFIDVDAKRPAGISATDEEVGVADQVATAVYGELARVLGSEHALGVGHSGNGRAVLVALDRIPETPELAAQVKALLGALDKRFSNERVQIDASVGDAKRLLPAWGTTKRKGAPNVADRPHRRTAFVCSDRVVRLRSLEPLVAALCREPPAEPTPKHDAPRVPRDSAAESPFRRANDVPVEEVADFLGLVEDGVVRCPGCGSSGSSVAYVRNALKCSHARCAHEGAPGKPGFRTNVDLVAKVRSVSARQAVTILAERFGFNGFGARRAPSSDESPPKPKSRGEWKQDDSAAKTLRLLDIMRSVPMFRAPSGRVFAEVGDEAICVEKSQTFRQWTASEFLRRHGSTVSATSIDNAALAFCGPGLPVRPVPLRIGGAPTHIVLDLGDRSGRTISVSREGWSVRREVGVAFQRPAGTEALPEPIFEGRDGEAAHIMNEFRAALGLDDAHAWTCCVAWLLAVMRPVGPYPLLILQGEQGSGKTWLARALRSVVDPRTPGDIEMPRDTRDLAIIAENAHVIAIDNVSYIDGPMSDALCRLATGAGFMTRALHTDRELSVFHAARPVVLTSITDAVTQPDLLDRGLVVRLPHRTKRQTQEAFDERLQELAPRVLGALVYIAHRALEMFDEVKVPDSLRMQAAARFAAAGELAAGLPLRAVERAYLESREHAKDVGGADPVLGTLLGWLTPGSKWEGEIRQLLQNLTDDVVGGGDGKRARRTPRGWPESERDIRGRLQRLVPLMRGYGIDITFDRKHPVTRRRMVKLERSHEGDTTA